MLDKMQKMRKISQNGRKIMLKMHKNSHFSHQKCYFSGLGKLLSDRFGFESRREGHTKRTLQASVLLLFVLNRHFWAKVATRGEK